MGRKSKTGARTKSGRLKRDNYPAPVYDRGSDWVQQQRAHFGEHYSSALGRAFAAHLIGEDQQAKDRYDAGKKFARVYNRVIQTRTYRCALDTSPHGNVVALEADHDHREQDWLFNAMADLDVAGLRPWLDQLISPVYVDTGPKWLDRLLKGGRDPVDRMLLDTAVKALDMLVPERRETGILVVRSA